MTNATHGNQTSQVTVYAAIELSKKSWVISIARPDRDQPSIHRITGAIFPSLLVGCKQQRRTLGVSSYVTRPDMTASGWRAC